MGGRLQIQTLGTNVHNNEERSQQPLTWLVQMRGTGLVKPVTPPFVWPFFGFLLQTLNHEVFQLYEDLKASM